MYLEGRDTQPLVEANNRQKDCVGCISLFFFVEWCCLFLPLIRFSRNKRSKQTERFKKMTARDDIEQCLAIVSKERNTKRKVSFINEGKNTLVRHSFCASSTGHIKERKKTCCFNITCLLWCLLNEPRSYLRIWLHDEKWQKDSSNVSLKAEICQRQRQRLNQLNSWVSYVCADDSRL